MKLSRQGVALSACFGVLLVGSQYIAAQDEGGERTPPKPRLVWAAKPVSPTPYEPPNRLIWRVSDILAAHKGQASWLQPVARTRDFEATYVSMAPGEKTKRQFYAHFAQRRKERQGKRKDLGGFLLCALRVLARNVFDASSWLPKSAVKTVRNSAWGRGFWLIPAASARTMTVPIGRLPFLRRS